MVSVDVVVPVGGRVGVSKIVGVVHVGEKIRELVDVGDWMNVGECVALAVGWEVWFLYWRTNK